MTTVISRTNSHRQHNTKLRVAAHHAGVRFCRFFKWVAFDHRAYAPKLGKAQRIFREAAGVPAAHPLIDLLPMISWTGATSIGSKAAPITRSLPFGPRPPTNSDMAFEFGAVARMTLAPPSRCSSSAAFCALLSI